MKRRTSLALLTLLITISTPAGVVDNDATCDIKVGPAATLLLPYFEVDLNPGGRTTLFTITNVSRYSQIAHVTLWTDFGFPVLTFNIFLAGYDVQSINLRDILVSGIVASPVGTGPTTVKSPLGALSLATGYANPNFKPITFCDALPGIIPQTVMAGVRQALGTGVAPGFCTSPVGGTHANDVGYATIDVVSSCTSRLPTDPLYYAVDLLFDNVLIGDYQQVSPNPTGSIESDPRAASFGVGGNPMVHIRAVPEGGAAGSSVLTELPFTFYDRYTPTTNRTCDRRQPLPATFAARYIEGGAGSFSTTYTIWREGLGSGACAPSLSSFASLPVDAIVRFDERDNVLTVGCIALCQSIEPSFPPTSVISTRHGYFPPNGNDVGGWMYLNLSNGGSTGYSVTRNIGGISTIITGAGSTSNLASSSGMTGPRPSQNWVTITMFGSIGTKQLVAEFDAASLGNGCSPAALLRPKPVPPTIGPAGGVFVCPPGTTLTNGTTALCTGTNANPRP